jgi:hypothetical protein
MKIEIGESLLLSWLRHVKECQIVQTNWKASSSWELKNKEFLLRFMSRSHQYFAEKYDYNLYKKSSFGQLIQQAEIDVLGIAFEENANHIYAIDVAFHESGLNYGSRQETTERVIKKCLRSVMCICGYFGFSNATIIFTAPKTTPAIVKDIQTVVADMELLLEEFGLGYEISIITNEDFNTRILVPIMEVIGNVADTTELFMRSLQLYKLFPRENLQTPIQSKMPNNGNELGKALEEMKIGVIVRNVVREILESGRVPSEELLLLQNLEYSKKTFHISLSFLQPSSNDFDRVRYYASPVRISDDEYYICSQWYDEQHRPYILDWISKHA